MKKTVFFSMELICDKNENPSIKQQYIQHFVNEIGKIRTNTGILNGEKVAVYTKGRIHFDPQR